MSILTIVAVGFLVFMIQLALFAHYGRIRSEKRDQTLLIIKRSDLAIELSLKDHCPIAMSTKREKSCKPQKVD